MSRTGANSFLTLLLSLYGLNARSSEDFSVGYAHSCAITENNELHCWSTETQVETLAPPTDFQKVTSFFTDHFFACAAREDGQRSCWGHNADLIAPKWKTLPNLKSVRKSEHVYCGWSEEGLISFLSPARPAADRVFEVPADLRQARLCAPGYEFSCAVKDGPIKCWGNVYIGPSAFTTFQDVRHLTNLGGTLCAGNSDGRLACWWNDSPGESVATTRNLQFLRRGIAFYLVEDGVLKRSNIQSADYSFENLAYIENPRGLEVDETFDAEYLSGFCVQDGQTMMCSRSRNQPMLKVALRHSPDTSGLPNSHYCYLKDAKVYCLGSGNIGQAGYFRTSPALKIDGVEPVKLPESFRPTKVISTLGRSCALSHEGKIYCWGKMDKINLASFQKKVRDITFGESFLCALQTDDTLACSGEDFGDVVDVKDFAPLRLHSGYRSVCVENADGELRCFGKNVAALPQGDLPRFKKFSMGREHACGIVDAPENNLLCFGRNQFGQLLQGNSKDSRYPLIAKMGTDTSVKDLACGNNHCCAITLFNTLKCWGSNTFGQLGLGDTQDRGLSLETSGDELKPIKLPNSEPVLALEAFDDMTCATTRSGKRCWGYNVQGQLGYGDRTNKGDTLETIPAALPPRNF